MSLGRDVDSADAAGIFRVMKLVALAAVVAAAFSLTAAEPMKSIYDLPLKTIEGKETTLKPYAGKVLVIVNVASECGYTGQYAGLEALYRKYKDQGLVVLGFPCNQFGGQEPGSNSEILQFCQSRYDVTFPMFAKIDVQGPKAHPLFVQLIGKNSPAAGEIGWNFEKILVGRDGKVIRRFGAGDEPDSGDFTGPIEAALKQK